MKTCPRCNAKLPKPAGDDAPVCPACGMTVWAQGTGRPRQPWLPRSLKTGCAVIGTAGLASAMLLAWLLSLPHALGEGDAASIKEGAFVADSRESLIRGGVLARERDAAALEEMLVSGELMKMRRAPVKIIGIENGVAEIEVQSHRRWRGFTFVSWLR